MTKSIFRVLGVVASMVFGGVAVAADSPAIEWKVIDGGNGHWYQFSNQKIGWNASSILALNKAGYLATITSANENTFISNYLNVLNCWENAERGPLLGAFQDINSPNYIEPKGGWTWVTGETWNLQFWHPRGEPNNSGGGVTEEFLAMDNGGWNDMNGEYLAHYSGLLIEWSADCNGDGVVDYGQIQSGELADTNHNNIPDVCEIHVTYVQPISGPASGGTAVNINGVNFPNSVSVLFGGVAATDVVVVSPTLISAVTPVGVPGMTVVTVNGVGGEAFYYRSNCQSDLDGSGGVDSSDLGILLLDFGSCGESAAVAPQPEPLILQSIEPATPVLNKK